MGKLFSAAHGDGADLILGKHLQNHSCHQYDPDQMHGGEAADIRLEKQKDQVGAIDVDPKDRQKDTPSKDQFT